MGIWLGGTGGRWLVGYSGWKVREGTEGLVGLI